MSGGPAGGFGGYRPDGRGLAGVWTADSPPGQRRDPHLRCGGGQGRRAADWEQTVHGLLWLRRGDLWRYRIIIVDCGLEERGQKIARYLSRDHDQVVVCNREDLARLLADRPSGAET